MHNALPRRRTPPWRWVALAAALSWSCVGVQRPTTLTVGGDLSHAQPEFVSRGCDGDLIRRQQHRQTGLSAHMRYEHSGGGLFKARLRGVMAERTADSGDRASGTFAPRGGYGLLALGVAGGFDARYAGIEAGIAGLGNGDEVWAVPYGQLRVGQLDTIWFAGTVGTLDPAHFVRLIGLGVGARNDHVRLHAGFALASYALEPEPGQGISLDAGEDDLIPGLEFDLQLRARPDSALALEVGGLVAEYPAGRIGLSYRY